MPAPPEGRGDSILAAFDLKPVKVATQPVSRWLMLAYDDEYSIQYFKKNLRPYWRRNGDDAAALLKKAAAEYESLKPRCEEFDAELMAALTKAGGEKYARICALAYRQCYAANKVVADANGQPLMFPKENFSNGCIGTVDVIYPMAPQFLLFSPSLAKAMLVPILDYAASPRWRWPFAPHDLGTYPHANGQVYGGGERTEENQMPVEETGNMLILLAALAQVEGNAEFCREVLARARQVGRVSRRPRASIPRTSSARTTSPATSRITSICRPRPSSAWQPTASFAGCAGRRPRRTNIGSWRGASPGSWARRPMEGDHSRLAFDRPGTWSQKYNPVWDRILGIGLAGGWRKRWTSTCRT